MIRRDNNNIFLEGDPLETCSDLLFGLGHLIYNSDVVWRGRIVTTSSEDISTPFRLSLLIKEFLAEIAKVYFAISITAVACKWIDHVFSIGLAVRFPWLEDMYALSHVVILAISTSLVVGGEAKKAIRSFKRDSEDDLLHPLISRRIEAVERLPHQQGSYLLLDVIPKIVEWADDQTVGRLQSVCLAFFSICQKAKASRVAREIEQALPQDIVNLLNDILKKSNIHEFPVVQLKEGEADGIEIVKLKSPYNATNYSINLRDMDGNAIIFGVDNQKKRLFLCISCLGSYTIEGRRIRNRFFAILNYYDNDWWWTSPSRRSIFSLSRAWTDLEPTPKSLLASPFKSELNTTELDYLPRDCPIPLQKSLWLRNFLQGKIYEFPEKNSHLSLKDVSPDDLGDQIQFFHQPKVNSKHWSIYKKESLEEEANKSIIGRLNHISSVGYFFQFCGVANLIYGISCAIRTLSIRKGIEICALTTFKTYLCFRITKRINKIIVKYYVKDSKYRAIEDKIRKLKEVENQKLELQVGKAPNK